MDICSDCMFRVLYCMEALRGVFVLGWMKHSIAYGLVFGIPRKALGIQVLLVFIKLFSRYSKCDDYKYVTLSPCGFVCEETVALSHLTPLGPS